jgi:hypothetical protein
MENQTDPIIKVAIAIEAPATQGPLVKAKAHAKRLAELDKLTRQIARDIARRLGRTPDQVELCGLNVYNRSAHTRVNGNYWHNCPRCGQPLYCYYTTKEAQTNNRECSCP